MQAERPGKLLKGQLRDVPVEEAGGGIVGLVRSAALFFVIDAAEHVYARTAQAVRHAPRTTKKIDGTEDWLDRGRGAKRHIHDKRPAIRRDTLP